VRVYRVQDATANIPIGRNNVHCRSPTAVDRDAALRQYEQQPGAGVFADGPVEEITTIISSFRWPFVIDRRIPLL
jgi:hypothetical protein